MARLTAEPAGPELWTSEGWPVPAAWVEVVTRDRYRCTCTGQCGRKHDLPPVTDGRCDVEDRTRFQPVPGEVLVMAAADPSVSPEHAVRLPAAELVTWCPRCRDGAVSRAASARRRAVKKESRSGEESGGNTLF
jgi:hypothetical protein